MSRRTGTGVLRFRVSVPSVRLSVCPSVRLSVCPSFRLLRLSFPSLFRLLFASLSPLFRLVFVSCQQRGVWLAPCPVERRDGSFDACWCLLACGRSGLLAGRITQPAALARPDRRTGCGIIGRRAGPQTSERRLPWSKHDLLERTQPTQPSATTFPFMVSGVAAPWGFWPQGAWS